IARLYTLILTAAVPVLLVLQTGSATAEAIRIGDPSLLTPAELRRPGVLGTLVGGRWAHRKSL
ncbi:hypothetical protein ABZ260_26270, partial [Streptosporangium sp. NPDC006013]|uniref:hypothetical protein n=1 Tax=Streptosporangium sp. NPDC006013 TaxID=3155596 RepID=UPI0033AB273F